MNARTIPLALLALAVASPTCQLAAQQVGPLSDADVSAIRGVVDGLREAELAGDWDAVEAFFAEDVVFMLPDQEFGRAAWRAMVDEMQLTFHELTFEVAEIDGRADLAFLRGTLKHTISVGGARDESHDVGKYLWILKKQPGGSWLITVRMGMGA